MSWHRIYIENGPLREIGAGYRTVWAKEQRRYVYVVCPFTLTVSRVDKRTWADFKPADRPPVRASLVRRAAKERASYKAIPKSQRPLVKEMVGMTGWFR